MKKILLITTICVIWISSVFAQENTKSITVNISGLNSEKGKVIVAIFDSADNFLIEPVFRKCAIIKDNKATVCFENIKIGTYAFMCFHDENGNEKLDFSAMGKPKERLGVSNNAKGFFGPPKFQSAKFLIQDKDIIQNIEL